MTHFEYETQERGFFQRFGIVIGIVVVAIVIGGVFFAGQFVSGPKRPRAAQPVEIVIRPLPPPPVTPPPPPPPPQKLEETMEEIGPVDESEEKPDEAPAAPTDAALSTGISGPGTDGFGLSNRGGKSFLEGGSAAKRKGTKHGWYFAQVQRTLREALQGNKRTRNADFVVEVRIWSDRTGRIERAKLAGTTGDAAIDAALTRDILPGLQLQEPPPAGLKMPLVLRFTAKRPS